MCLACPVTCLSVLGQLMGAEVKLAGTCTKAVILSETSWSDDSGAVDIPSSSQIPPHVPSFRTHQVRVLESSRQQDCRFSCPGNPGHCSTCI
ncbi:hypothetical protein QBC37DRAFT_420439 [Rhypophila decipiens]|uniref:Secreted protein n=1 Tax=Rhypophila decipiens TaxID=261697 RepID=A0AAN6YB73_9PEZI|nr:hypothetical protein QBC37DRAFT_420439 [Rhypophila decipiens]